MLTIGDFNSFWVFLGHPVELIPRGKRSILIKNHWLSISGSFRWINSTNASLELI